MIILHETGRDIVAAKLVFAKALREEATRIAKNPGLDQQKIGNLESIDSHRSSRFVDVQNAGSYFERKHPASKGDAWLLVHIWIQRFTYRQVFSIVLFKTIKRAIDGKPFNWDKLERTAKMSKQAEAIAEHR